jgi:hypothetical protein
MKKNIFGLALLLIAGAAAASQQLNDTDYIFWGTGPGPTQLYGSSSQDYLRLQLNGADIWATTPTGFGLGTNAPTSTSLPVTARPCN